MNTVNYKTCIEIPHQQAWQLLKDLSVPQNYVPGVTRTEITTELTEGIGASRLVFLLGFIPMRETVSAWQDGRGFSIQLGLKNSPLPFPLRRAFFHYDIEPLASDTVISNSLDFQFNWSWLDKTIGVISKPIVKIILWKITSNMRQFYLQSQA
mgnify:CR=1 FL=1